MVTQGGQEGPYPPWLNWAQICLHQAENAVIVLSVTRRLLLNFAFRMQGTCWPCCTTRMSPLPPPSGCLWRNMWPGGCSICTGEQPPQLLLRICTEHTLTYMRCPNTGCGCVPCGEFGHPVQTCLAAPCVPAVFSSAVRLWCCGIWPPTRGYGLMLGKGGPMSGLLVMRCTLNKAWVRTQSSLLCYIQRRG